MVFSGEFSVQHRRDKCYAAGYSCNKLYDSLHNLRQVKQIQMKMMSYKIGISMRAVGFAGSHYNGPQIVEDYGF